MSAKRSYTVPILLVIITVMATMLMLLYSKQLLADQTETTEEGKRLAENYTQAVRFAERLHNAADLLLKDDAPGDRLRAKMWLGETAVRSESAAWIFAEAARRSTGQTFEKEYVPFFAAMDKIFAENKAGNLRHAAEHDGPLTQEEKEMLATVYEGAAAMREALDRFRAPTLEAGYRHMAAGQDWVEPANAAGKALQDMAAQMK